MTLAESILRLLDGEQTQAEAVLAKAKTEYEAAQKEYDTAFNAQFAGEDENYAELAKAAARAKGKMEAYRSSYDYFTGKKNAVDLLNSFIRTEIKNHEAVYGKSVPADSVDFFDEVTA